MLNKRSIWSIVLFIAFFLIGTISILLIKPREQLSEDEIFMVNKSLEAMTSIPSKASSPFEDIEENNEVYKQIINLGDPVVDYFLVEFKNSSTDGSREWVMAWICNEILGDRNPIKIWELDHKNGWDSGRDWYEKYTGTAVKIEIKKFPEPDKIILYSKGKTKEIDKNHNKFSSIVKLNNKRITSDGIKSMVEEACDELVSNEKKYMNAMEFVYNTNKNMEIGTQTITYNKLFFKIYYENSDTTNWGQVEDYFKYYDGTNYKSSIINGLETSPEINKIIEDIFKNN